MAADQACDDGGDSGQNIRMLHSGTDSCSRLWPNFMGTRPGKYVWRVEVGATMDKRDEMGTPRARRGFHEGRVLWYLYSALSCRQRTGLDLCSMWVCVSGGPAETRESARDRSAGASRGLVGEGKTSPQRYGAKRGAIGLCTWVEAFQCGAVANLARNLEFSSHGPRATPDMADGPAPIGPAKARGA